MNKSLKYKQWKTYWRKPIGDRRKKDQLYPIQIYSKITRPTVAIKTILLKEEAVMRLSSL